MNIEMKTPEYSEETLCLLAKALVPEIQAFYQSEKGREYYENWLNLHPDYADESHSHNRHIRQDKYADVK